MLCWHVDSSSDDEGVGQRPQDYELLRLQNIERNKSLLASLGLTVQAHASNEANCILIYRTITEDCKYTSTSPQEAEHSRAGRAPHFCPYQNPSNTDLLDPTPNLRYAPLLEFMMPLI